MSGRKLLSIYEWMTGTLRKARSARYPESCKFCQLPLEELRCASAPMARDTYCQVCWVMIEAASTPYFLAIHDRYEEEQKRKRILMLGGNYLS